jgi:hypothetical protein
VREAWLPAEEIAELIEDLGCAEEWRRLLPAALAVRLMLAMMLLPGADVPEAIRRAVGLLEYGSSKLAGTLSLSGYFG